MTCSYIVLIVFIIVVQLRYKMLYCIVNVVTAKEHRYVQHIVQLD